MITVEFNHTITRTADQVPFFPGSNPTTEESDIYNYAMELINNGFNGKVNMTHTEDEFTWQNTFTCDVETWQQFKETVAADAKFTESMRLGHIYSVQNNLTQNVTVIFRDQNGNIIEESDAY